MFVKTLWIMLTWTNPKLSYNEQFSSYLKGGGSERGRLEGEGGGRGVREREREEGEGEREGRGTGTGVFLQSPAQDRMWRNTVVMT